MVYKGLPPDRSSKNMSISAGSKSETLRVPLTARVLWTHRWFLGLLFSYCVLMAVVCAVYGRSVSFSLSLYTGPFALYTALFCVGFFVVQPFRIMLFERPDRLTSAILGDLRDNYFTLERLLPASLILLLIPPFISSFTSFKSIIPMIQPFSWDPFFAEVDRWLHGGIDPWRLLQPLLGRPFATTTINFFYHLWYFAFFTILFWQAFSLKAPQLRLRFLISFLLIWAVVGSLAAVTLSSAGPVYYGRVTGLEDPFAELMAYLTAASARSPVWALEIQQLLWDSYLEGGTGFGSGISAMPSVHVAMAVLLAILGWHTSKVLGVVLTLFAVLIQVGSVHLGWHYAIDGYFAGLLTWAIWLMSGWLADHSLGANGRSGG